MKLISLFAGIGGFDLGFERAGIETVAVVERDPNCRKLLAAKFPKAQVFDDVCTVGKHNLPDADIVAGGFPCQDLSVAGLRAGLAGKRSGLFYQLTRITYELHPAFLVWENVPGLLSSNNGRDFLAVLVELDRIGYHGAWRLLDAQHFGVAQRRRRVFGVFARGDIGAERCAEILSLQEGLLGHPPPRREAGQRPSGTIAARTKGGGGLGTDHELDGGLVPAGDRSLCAGRDGYNDGSDQTYIAGALTSGGDGHSAGSATLQDALSRQLIPEIARSLMAERGQRNNATENNLIPGVSDPISANEGKTYTHEGKGNFRLHNVVAVEKREGDAYKCGDCSHFGHQTAHGTRCPRCDSPDGYWNVMIEPTVGPDAGKVFDFSDGRYKERLIAFSANDSGADAEEISPTLRAGTHDASHENGGVMPAVAFQESQTGVREYPEAGTLRANGPRHDPVGTRIHDGMTVRRLTPRECERLQGFPDDWTAGFADSVRYRMCGNAVAVPCSEWIANRIKP